MACTHLLKAIDAVLGDPAFSTSSITAACALKSAKSLQEWCGREENDEAKEVFTSELLSDLQAAFLFPRGKRLFNRERLAELITNEEVQFHWSIASAAFDVDNIEVHDEVLRMIAELYLTIRGFSYASAWVEQYKQMHKKSTQRSKGLCKRLYTDKNS